MNLSVPFVKVHGCANDFVLVDLTAWNTARRNRVVATLDSKLVRNICDRRRGIGADGVLVLTDDDGSTSAEILNADGTAGGMCGNGLRCIALYLLRIGAAQPGQTLNVLMGSRPTSILIERDHPFRCALDLGRVEPCMKSAVAPLSDHDRSVLRDAVGDACLDSAWAGNPHLVIFVNGHPEERDLVDMASKVRETGVFSSGVNISLAFAASPGRVVAMTDERGVGPTQACASGAAAIVATGRRAGLLGSTCTVAMPGGELAIELVAHPEAIDSPPIARVSGTAEIVFSGTLPLSAAGFEA
ncbi:diaminopimelate epimerase [Phycisphaerales bacterium ac7]